MAIATFSALRTQVASWVNRTDLTTAQLSLFVGSAESDIRNDLEYTQGDTVATGTVSSNTITVPSDFLSIRTLTVDDYVLDYVTPTIFAQKSHDGFVSGYYTIRGETIRVLGGTSYTLEYHGEITALSADSDSNWLLATAPNVYLFGACKYASVFLRDAEGAAGYGTLYRSAIDSLNRSQARARHGSNLMIRAA